MVVKAMNMNRQGQSCSSTSRILVHDSLHESVSNELVKVGSAIPVGFPWIEDAEMGPIVSRHLSHGPDRVCCRREDKRYERREDPPYTELEQHASLEVL